ncbi:porin [Paracoccus jeotgali]|nr:porin [Paracoccus jeotgali]
MKKVLFATTALVMTAGVAAAEVAVSGDARIGLRYESNTNYGDFARNAAGDIIGYDEGDSSWNVVNRARVKFHMTGESDAGITFGAKVRADQAARANRGDNNSSTAGEVYVSGAYGKLTAGDIDGALEKAVGDLPEVGLTGLDFWNEFAYATSEEVGGDASLLYEYSFGNANIYASFSDGYIGNTSIKRDDNAWAIGLGYDLGDYTFGIGYESAEYTINPFVIDDDGIESVAVGPLGFAAPSDTWGISGGTSWNGITFKAAYLKTSSDDDLLDYAQYGLGMGYEMSNGVGLTAFYRKNDFKNVDVDGRAFGLGASYDLGGGATIKGGVVDSKINVGSYDIDNTLADFGLEFKF